MAKARAVSPILHAVRLNSKRRVVRYAECRAAGDSWMIECRDLWDSEDEDAGVYFAGCKTKHGVDAFLKKLDPSSDRVLGIYDLSRPLDEQGPGLTLEEWKSR